MSKNLTSLNSGALKCGASQFKANIPSIQGVTLSPATPNPVNFVFEIGKADADNFVTALSAASVPHYIEEYTKGNDIMFRIYAAIPETPGAFAEAELLILTPANIYCYKSGVLPISWLVEMLQNNSRGSNMIFVNSVETAEDGQLFNSQEDVNVLFMKDAVLMNSALNLPYSSTLVFNGAVTLYGGAVAMNSYQAESPEDSNTTVVIAPQPDVANIKDGAIDGDIMNLYYNGEWNTTTRAWFSGSIYHLNGEALDPIPSE